MVSFFEAEPQLVTHRHVLELGAGPGAVGLALASTGDVSSLLLTDLESVLPLTCSNARAAAALHASAASLAASERLAVHALCWCAAIDKPSVGHTESSREYLCCRRGEPADAVIAGRQVDVVVASDCLYESASHSAFLSTLLDVTTPRSPDSRTRSNHDNIPSCCLPTSNACQRTY